MSEDKSPFTKLHVEEVTPDKRTLLDELNLPPKATKFIRENAKTIKIAVVSVTLIICAWSLYDYYVQKQRNDSAAMLAQAMEVKEPEARDARLKEVIEEYPRTGAATWSKVTLAHDLLDDKKFGEARSILNDILAGIGKQNPLYPLILQDLAQTCELEGDFEAALKHYTSLQETVGFATTGYLGQARIYAQMDKTDLARQTYEKIKTQTDLDPATREWVEAKLASM